MYVTLAKVCFVCLLLWPVKFSVAQKSIVISDSLAANAERLPVRTGNAWPWKVYNFSFGDYTITSSKAGWTAETSKTNLPGTKSHSESSRRFSFVLTGKTRDSAAVNAAYRYTLRELHQTGLFPVFFVGRDELLEESNNFTASITLNGDTGKTWMLFIIDASGTSVENKYEAFLTNTERIIFLRATSADKNAGKNHLMSALGYEFMEEGQALCALQYFGGGMLGVNKKVIWMHKVLDAKMKLILAAAMTAVMQLKS